MNLFNKNLLQRSISSFNFPTGESLKKMLVTIGKWQKALKDSDLTKTKEEAIQGDFLSVFFYQILGYEKLSTSSDEYNLIVEPKTEVDSQKADGSLGFFTKDKKETKVVIELKDARTSLDKKQNGRDKGYTPIEQAYLYATKFDGCDWIIISNFREIRLYNKHRTQDYFEKFDILELNQEAEFKKFYYLLCKKNFVSKFGKSPTTELIEKSQQQQEDISKKFYTDFKQVRLSLFQHLVENNSGIDKTVLFEKAQKILDRTIFILFCEDTVNLLPVGILKETYELGKRSRERNDEKIWREIKNLFIDIDVGRNDIDPAINKYNGGLFASDAILDNLHIRDTIWEQIIALTAYDFGSDLNVNILGHIFEQSIADIENIKAEIAGQEIDKKKSKRKKDGIYYTPEYITRYLVENTVGRYLQENPDKLENIKILDPACGSGAFLNQAHAHLVHEYKERFEQKVLEKKDNLTLWDANIVKNDRAILLNNLYGVDLNGESVEITKLSLWLKTAKASEPLQNLDKNIKCGNSLIDDAVVAGDKAFNWNREFEDIMKNGGFDVIIGNPPYIFARGGNFDEKIKQYYYKNFPLASYQLNTYLLFIDQAFRLLKTGGYFGFIIPNTWLTIDTFSPLRKFLLEETTNLQIINIIDKVFGDASVDTCLLIFKKGASNQITIGEFRDSKLEVIGDFPVEQFNKNNYIINITLAKNKEKTSILDKIQSTSKNLELFSTVKAGLKAYETGKGTPVQTEEMKTNRIYHSRSKDGYDYEKYLEGKDVKRYEINWGGTWLRYGHCLAAPRDKKLFTSPRILVRQIPSPPPYSINAVFTEETLLNDINSMVIYDFKVNPLFILGIINSKLMTFWFINQFDKLQRGIFPQFKVKELATFPIVNVEVEKQKIIAEKVEKMLFLQQQCRLETSKILEFMKDEFKLPKISNTLSVFYSLGWNQFVEELEKQKINFSLSQKQELRNWFNENKKKIAALKTTVDAIDEDIDQEVYKLYNLTPEEIKTIETSI